MEDSHLFVRILFIQPFSSLRDKVFPLRSRPFSIFLVSCFPRSIRSHLCRQVVDRTPVGVVIHFLPEGPSLRRIPVIPQIQEAPFHELLISDPVRSKMRKAFHVFVQARCLDPSSPSLDDGCAIRSDAQLRRSLQNDRTKWKPVRCNTTRASLSLRFLSVSRPSVLPMFKLMLTISYFVLLFTKHVLLSLSKLRTPHPASFQFLPSPHRPSLSTYRISFALLYIHPADFTALPRSNPL